MTTATNIKRIAILTSGGDCAGLNAAIRGAVHRARLTYGWDVVGIRNGTHGFAHRPVQSRPLELNDVSSSMMHQGGTILGSISKGDPFKFVQPDGSVVNLTSDIIEGMRMSGVDAIVMIGGDGSFGILDKLLEGTGINFVGVPKTIDNDVGKTEMSIGFHTAVDVATEALDRLQPTAASHQRVMVLEVMGRDAGHIALESGIAGGADVILIPEIKWNIESVTKKIKAVHESGRDYALVVVSEAARTADGESVMKQHADGRKNYGGIGDYVAHQITETTGYEARCTVLGHVQRGCPPNAIDRMVGQAFGVHAVDLIAQGKFGRMVAWQNRRVVDIPLKEAIASYQGVDPDSPILLTARALGICMGD